MIDVTGMGSPTHATGSAGPTMYHVAQSLRHRCTLFVFSPIRLQRSSIAVGSVRQSFLRSSPARSRVRKAF
eukprot:2397914-Rhodomonas_salina.1